MTIFDSAGIIRETVYFGRKRFYDGSCTIDIYKCGRYHASYGEINLDNLLAKEVAIVYI